MQMPGQPVETACSSGLITSRTTDQEAVSECCKDGHVNACGCEELVHSTSWRIPCSVHVDISRRVTYSDVCISYAYYLYVAVETGL